MPPSWAASGTPDPVSNLSVKRSWTMSSTQAHGDVAFERWKNRVESQSATPETHLHDKQRPARALAEQPRTVAEAAGELGLSVHTIRAWVSARRLAHIRLGRAIRIPAAEIRRVIERNTVPAIEER
jgi:excisionase family DNA binding protein